MDEFYRRLDAETVDDDMPGLTWADRERERVRRLVHFAYSTPLAPVMLGLVMREPDLALADAEHTRTMTRYAAANLRRAQASSELSAALDPELAGAVIMGGLRQAIALALTSPEPPPPDALADALWTLVHATVSVDALTDGPEKSPLPQHP